ncbi:MAG: glucosamine-6-phosphate deaminase, partial [Ginsengibacter sp.]
EVANKIKTLLKKKEFVNIIFAAAPSQDEFLEALSADKSVYWKAVNAFHMDEYIGLSRNAPQGFGNFLKERMFGKLPFCSVNYINGNAANLDAECKRYAQLLNKYPADIVCMGIGENTHIAFNEPHEADFKDLYLVKVVSLDDVCRQQQVNDGCFANLSEVPTRALTLTIPALLKAESIYCMVPGSNKADAVFHTLKEKVSEQYPSSILRCHPNAVLYLDNKSAAKITDTL